MDGREWTDDAGEQEPLMTLQMTVVELQTAVASFPLRNVGGGVLAWHIVTADAWAAFAPQNGFLSAEEEVNITATFTALPELVPNTAHTGTAQLITDDGGAGNKMQNIPLRVFVQSLSGLLVLPQALTLSATPGAPTEPRCSRPAHMHA